MSKRDWIVGRRFSHTSVRPAKGFGTACPLLYGLGDRLFDFEGLGDCFLARWGGLLLPLLF